jgi:hypothetical protein
MGVANLAGAVTSGMPIGASASRSAATEAAASRSQMPGLVSALIVMLVALYFTDLVAEIPSAALAGLVANAVVSIIDVRAFRTVARVRRSEFLIALGCTGGVLVLGPIGGLVLATLATMVDMVRRIAGSPWVTLEPPEGDWEIERFAAVADPDAPPSELEGVSFVRLTDDALRSPWRRARRTAHLRHGKRLPPAPRRRRARPPTGGLGRRRRHRGARRVAPLAAGQGARSCPSICPSKARDSAVLGVIQQDDNWS